MTSKPSIRICHSDESLVAEVSFWAGSAGFDLVTLQSRSELLHAPAGGSVATILELTGTNDEEMDVIEALSKRPGAKVIAVTQLESKTIASVRRLFQAKSVDAILLSRADFSTRQLADLLETKSKQPALTRETLGQAIADGHVIVHYQPKVPFRPGEKNYGVEALCRIQHPDLGLIYPDNFIPLAEAHDLILELTDAVTVQAFRDLHAWDELGPQLRLAINISPRLMASKIWFELFEHRCQEHQVDPKRITLEVTESSSQGGKILALEILSRLRLKGFLLSIDDFGTGFSSLETLYKLPFGELKIDKGFVFDLLKNAEARALVESTISLARKLGLKICAEGVETEEMFQELRNLQCDDAQGYFISRPIAAGAIVPFFEKWDTDNAVRGNSAATKLKAIHGLLADILSGPDDEDDATVVISQGRGGPDAESGRDIAAKLPALVLAGDLIGSLELIHRVLRAEPQSDFRRKLLSLQAELERSLLDKDLAITDGQRTVWLLSGDNFTIGRVSASSGAEVAIPCRWLSRGAKNLRLQQENGRWQVSDLGSTNGHFWNDVRLKPNVALPLDSGETVLEVGKIGAEPAPAWLRFRVSRGNAVELSYGLLGADTAGQTWLLFDKAVHVGRNTEACLVVEGCGADFAADVSFRDNGFWIAPRPGETIHLGERAFSQAVPLAAGCTINFGGAIWHVEKAKPSVQESGTPSLAAASA
jgi:EAL domain-containing protein (putative c-di-GMP-specific phosphodiesterase class I)